MKDVFLQLAILIVFALSSVYTIEPLVLCPQLVMVFIALAFFPFPAKKYNFFFFFFFLNLAIKT